MYLSLDASASPPPPTSPSPRAPPTEDSSAFLIIIIVVLITLALCIGVSIWVFTRYVSVEAKEAENSQNSKFTTYEISFQR